MPNRLVIDEEEPYLVPLLELLHRQRRYLVVHTDTHRARLYTAVPGAFRMIEDIEEPVPKRHHAAGELWGKQQATIARHREDHITHYPRGLPREIERAWPEERYDGVVVAQAISECPSCHAACEKTNLWQAIALFAAQKHVTVHFVDPGHGLDTHVVSSRCSRVKFEPPNEIC